VRRRTVEFINNEKTSLNGSSFHYLTGDKVCREFRSPIEIEQARIEFGFSNVFAMAFAKVVYAVKF
jgi:hypothetical protein